MIFLVIAVNRQGNVRHLLFNHSELEAGFEVLNRLVARGHMLAQAILVDDESTIHLPVEAFDGHWGQSTIQELEHAWRVLLMNPLNRNNNSD
ncbi:hypothetical protein [Spirosoma foliorum]|uniref:Uncharacterized protein n=1 Tax=Spirosoma foliorum TaxID=2710596 RepID=A0A7G5H6G8_9BACT|nr:hypothetical protein [Spirosoma foliorum]QMW06710.1 hypothetical protein H3H32_18360 [Spirosoma foliorum]